MLPTRVLGATGLRVSVLGLGCSSLGGGVFYRNDAESIRLLNRAFERGVNFYDTADSYGYGHSERLLGRAFQGRRRDIIIATKAGFLPSSLANVARFALPVFAPFRRLLQPWKKPLNRASKKRQDFSPSHLIRAIEGSLRRLQTDYVDLYQLHNPPAAVLEEGGVFEVLERLKRQGKIRWYGVSAHTIEDAFIALRHSGVSTLQVVFNATEPEAAAQLFPAAARQQVGIIARVPLGRGLLTDRAKVQTGFWHDVTPAMQQRRLALEKLARTAGCPIPQMALQFVLSHPEVSTAISGTRSAQHLDENLQALERPPVRAEELSMLSQCL